MKNALYKNDPLLLLLCLFFRIAITNEMKKKKKIEKNAMSAVKYLVMLYALGVSIVLA